ncbi:DUF5655 domain-containing protein [Bacillus sp. AFS055030]|uniref:DUF5655 domain-containing protein n=1 Tax=Bacillus sp. AFS055030 TaxID=2033507 RepID=UPI000BFCBE2B|nr:DUF5655 domain-containing protein [Bacillus sp. AFS055030]PGL67925.1 DNA replication protein DnaC [Bacillus sp. AFS055030]
MSEDELFSNKGSNVYEIYLTLLDLLKEIGQFEVEFKKTSIHLLNKYSFGGVHPKKKWLDFNLVTNHHIEHENITKIEQVSKNRFHINFRFHSKDDINQEFLVLLKESYQLMG